MRLFATLLSLFLLFNSTDSLADWGKTGHRTTGEIAQRYLTPQALAMVNELLDNKSLALVSTYADEIKSDTLYRKYGTWHYVNYPFGSDYNVHPKSDKGDLMVGIDTAIQALKDPQRSKEEQAFHLKMLVHFIGDLHQPLHVGISKDRGGNRFQVQWFDEGTNLHRIWDSSLLDYYKMSYTELADTAPYLSQEEIKATASGTHYDWMRESRSLCEDVYAKTKVGANLKWDYAYLYMDTIRMQLQKGGIRLAMILNEVFA